MTFKVLTVGWEPYFINDILAPIEKKTGIEFTHGLVGDLSRVPVAKKQYPHIKFIGLSKTKSEPLPNPDYKILASLECVGVPTIKSMLQGDRVLRHRKENEAMGYATLLALRIRDRLKELKPDVVLASHDSLHSAMSLAVAKSLGIPWVAMAFSVIPDNLTGFCNALTPNSLVPIERPVDSQLRNYARELMQNVRSKKHNVMAYRAPASLSQWLRQYMLHAKNLIRRKQATEILGVDRYTYPSILERVSDITRRTFNRISLPSGSMLLSPPKARYIYYPLHMAPESTVDTWAPFFQNQLAFIAQLALAIPADVDFVVKLHFSDPDNYTRRQLQELMNMPNLYVAHPNASGNEFLEEASLVVGIQGTSSLEAALLGKPVLSFGDSPYQYFPRAERANRPDQLYEQIQRMLNLSAPTDDETVEAYAAYMARYMPGRINDWGLPIEKEQLDKYADTFLALRTYVENPVNRANWYNQLPFVNQ